MKKIIVTLSVLSSVIFAQSAQEIIDANGCTACHAVASKKAAPAFAGIGKRNKKFYGLDAKSHIINSIKNGSQGKFPKFADSAMPPYPTLTEEQLNTVAEYILAQSSKAKGCAGKGQAKGMNMGRGMQ